MPAIRGSKSCKKTRRRKRDLDQVHADVHDPKHLYQFKDSKASEDLPALGEYYCIECSKWFDGPTSIAQHKRGKPHKKRQVFVNVLGSRVHQLTGNRVKQLGQEPYTQRDADAAIGLQREQNTRIKMDLGEIAVDQPEELDQESPKHEDNDDEEYGAFFSAY